MKGTNELRVNQLTVMAAMQEYLDKRSSACAERQIVKSFRANNDYEFVVQITEESKSK